MRASVADPASVEYLRRLVGLQPGQSRIVEVHVSRVITSSHSGFLSATVVGILGGGELYDEAADATPANNDHVEVVIRSE
jgi:hypothetical protein